MVQLGRVFFNHEKHEGHEKLMPFFICLLWIWGRGKTQRVSWFWQTRGNESLCDFRYGAVESLGDFRYFPTNAR